MTEKLDNLKSETNTANKDFRVLTDEETAQVNGGELCERIICACCGNEVYVKRGAVICDRCNYNLNHRK